MRDPQSCVRRAWARRGEDRGAVTVEIVLVYPLLFTLILIIAQYAIWAHATHSAQATASHALAATRVQDGATAHGHREAQRVLSQLGRGPLADVSVRISRDDDVASVRIDGTASAVVPFLHLPVHAEASGKTETFRPDGVTEP